jgi:glutamate synthase domain-containing protein 2
MDADLVPLAKDGARSFHLVADYHGRAGGRFALELIRESHERLVGAGLREQVSLIGGGGVAAAEHVPKAILCGLDAVALDTAPWVALQARFEGECMERRSAHIALPSLDGAWAVQRLANLVAAWRDQLLEVLGAMGLREVRRLRGELGRAMFQAELEAEAFAGIEGYAV